MLRVPVRDDLAGSSLTGTLGTQYVDYVIKG